MKIHCPSLVRSLYWKAAAQQLQIEPWGSLSRRIGRDQSIAIVGNAGYLLTQSHGERIDGCDIVIRMNNFRLAGYQHHIGSRADVVVTNFSPYSIDFANPAMQRAPILVSSRPMNFFRHPGLEIRDRMGQHVVAGMKTLGAERVFVPDFDYFCEIVGRLRRYPTTGLMALRIVVDCLSEHCRELFLTGFSFFNGRSHYFSNASVEANQLHNLDAERQEFRQIVDRNRDWIKVDPIMQQYLEPKGDQEHGPPCVADSRRIA
jgi:hypothetical protein